MIGGEYVGQLNEALETRSQILHRRIETPRPSPARLEGLQAEQNHRERVVQLQDEIRGIFAVGIASGVGRIHHPEYQTRWEG
jgi:hypothetical protein